MAAQGSLAIFVIEIAVYAYLMNKQDLKYGIKE
jgi:putative solute:sodium symporter small subunit